MDSPASRSLEDASTKLNQNQHSEELLEKRKQIIGKINEAFNAVPRKESVQLDQYTHGDKEALEVSVRHDVVPPRIQRGNSTDLLYIKGSLSREDQQKAVELPMYRVSKAIPLTDGGALDPHYEVSVADPATEGGYKVLALIEQSILGSKEDTRVTGSGKIYTDLFDQHDQLTPEQMSELKTTGIFIDPQATAMLAEVQDILEQVVNQAGTAEAA